MADIDISAATARTLLDAYHEHLAGRGDPDSEAFDAIAEAAPDLAATVIALEAERDEAVARVRELEATLAALRGAEALAPLMGGASVAQAEALAAEREVSDERFARIEELEAVLANERGEGAPPSEGWVPEFTDEGRFWKSPRMIAAILADGWHWSARRGRAPYGVAPTARAAMLAADEALAALEAPDAR